MSVKCTVFSGNEFCGLLQPIAITSPKLSFMDCLAHLAEATKVMDNSVFPWPKQLY